MGKVKQLTLDRYEHGLAVRALYEEWKKSARKTNRLRISKTYCSR